MFPNEVGRTHIWKLAAFLGVDRDRSAGDNEGETTLGGDDLIARRLAAARGEGPPVTEADARATPLGALGVGALGAFPPG